MHRFARTSLALVGFSLAAPASLLAQDAPAGYAPGRSAAVGLDGKPVAATAPAPARHAHKGRVLCAKCMKAKEDQARMAPGKIVACAHSKNGVCTACAALLALPGTVTMGPPAMEVAAAPSAAAPGHAVVSGSGAPASGVQVAYDASGLAEPAPIGVMQANYSQGAPAGMMPAGSPMMMAAQPGRAVASSGPDAGPGPAPLQRKSGAFPHPRIIGHLIGFTGIGTEYRREKDARKKEAHAMMSYDAPGTTVNELPASVVYGKR